MDSNSQLLPPSSSASMESTEPRHHHSARYRAHLKLKLERLERELDRLLSTFVRQDIWFVIGMLVVMVLLSCIAVASFFIYGGILQQYGSDWSQLEINYLVRTTSKSVLRLKQQVPLRCEKPSVICDPMPVLCTVGSDTLSGWIVLPPIGYCSIIFYEAFGYWGRDTLGNKTSPRLSNFMQRAGERAGSDFGVAFHFEYAKAARDVLSSPNGTETLAPFQRQGIFHFGVLDAVSSKSSAELNLKATLDLFKLLRQLQRTRDADAPYLVGGIVFGIRMMRRQTKAQSDLINDIVKDFKVDMLVAVTHLGNTQGEHRPYRILPPTTWNRKYSSVELPIRDVVELLSERGFLNISIPVSVSFSLKGFWYAPLDTDQVSNFAPGSLCWVIGAAFLGSYAKVCNDPDYRDSLTAVEEGQFINYTFNKQRKLTFTFDSLQTITTKAVLAHHLHSRISFAVFDIDYADVYEECPGSVYGPFDRVAGVRWLTDRFKQLLPAADEGTTKPPG